MLSHKDFGKTGLNTAFTHFSHESVMYPIAKNVRKPIMWIEIKEISNSYDGTSKGAHAKIKRGINVIMGQST